MQSQRTVLFAGAMLCLTGCGELGHIPAAPPTSVSQGDTNSAPTAGSTGGGSTGGASTGGSTGGMAGIGAAPPPSTDIPNPNRTDWLTIKGNQFYRNGQVWMGRGVTLHDTRSCDFCTSKAPDVAEIERRVDEVVTNWHVNFIRLLLENFASAAYTDGSGGMRVQWENLLEDPNYLHDIREIVEYIGTKPGVYVMVSLWKDPNFTVADTTNNIQGGLPTAVTNMEAAKLAQVFANDAQVLLAVANEPEDNFDDSQDASCEASMSTAVQAVRAVEDANGTPHHIVAVQGVAQYGRVITYYATHPVSGDNIAYETHPYTPASNFPTSLVAPAQTIPVIIGEFAPASPYMTTSDATTLMSTADAHNIPWAAWDFHMHCNTDGTSNMLLQVTDNNQCIGGTPLTPSAWGSVVQQHIIGVQ